MRVKKVKSKASYKSGPLDNQKWENFARYIANGETQAKAAVLAGFKEANAHIRGSVLMKKPEIGLRVEELKRVSSERAVTGLSVNKAWVLRNLKEIALQAKSEGDWSGANRAWELIGKELGMFVERKVIGLQDLRNASADELQALLAELDSTIDARLLSEGDTPITRTDTETDQQNEQGVVPSLEPGKPEVEDPGGA